MVHTNTFKLMYKQTATGVSTTPAAVNLEDIVANNFSCDVSVTGGTVSALTVRIEGNQGGTTFDVTGLSDFSFAAGHLTDLTPATVRQFGSFGFAQGPMKKVRARIVTLTVATGTPAVTIICTVTP